MVIKKLFVFLFAVMVIVNVSYALQTNTSNYKHNLVVSSGGDTVSSGSYKSYAATGIVAGISNSQAYKNFIGFFYTWLLADGQPCASASQCEGGYCCSSLCKSSDCPVAAAAAAGGGGGGAAAGGGGGFIPKKKEFDISPSSIKIKLALGEEPKAKLKIKNTGSEDLTVSLKVDGVKDYLALSESAVDVSAEFEEEVELEITGRRLGSFTGKITAKADDIEKIIPVILEIISKLVLFDAKLDIPEGYEEVEPGEELKTQITLLNVGSPELVDVFATYLIKDLTGNVVYEETETFAVQKQVSYPKMFKIHETTVPGSYVAIVEIRYADSFAVSSQLFRVTEKKTSVEREIITKNTILMIFTSFILIGLISILTYKLISIKKLGRKKKTNKNQRGKKVYD